MTSLGTSRMAVKPLERVSGLFQETQQPPLGPQTLPRDFTAILLVTKLVLETVQLSCWFPDSSKIVHIYSAGPQTLPRYFKASTGIQILKAILLVSRLFLETVQLSCWFPDLSWRVFLETPQLFCWYQDYL